MIFIFTIIIAIAALFVFYFNASDKELKPQIIKVLFYICGGYLIFALIVGLISIILIN